MIEVRIRRDHDANAAHLTHVEPNHGALSGLLNLVSSWGTEEGGVIVGQFVVDGDSGRAYFELVIVSDE